MKLKKIIQYSFLVFTFILFQACQSENKSLPELTYSGDGPIVQNPLSPEESQQHIQVPSGMEVELFAAEPNIINPIAFSWDERGRLWVLQSMDYPHELENEVGGDRITICEDTDGDGSADKFIEFATNQSLSTGITIVKGGAIVAQAPEMVFLEDTNGDDKMDKRTVLFGGFGIWDTHAGPSNLRYGLDNHIWGAVGYSGFENKFESGIVNFSMGVYRFSRDGKILEPIGKFNNNTWGLGIGEDFEIYGSTANNNHICYVGIPLRYYDYMDKRPGWAMNSDFIQGHYEITAATTQPLQQVDVRGGYTAAAGANVYTARNFPEKYWNQVFVCEPTGHLVHFAKIVEDGAGYQEEDGGNIFASTDEWTAPVYSETGPDGNMWVADWYNPVIQHNPDKRGMDNQIWNAERGEGNAHLNPLRDKQHGRIYRIKMKKDSKSSITSLDPSNNEELLQGIQSDNMFWRTTSQRLIVENQIVSLLPALYQIVKDDKVDKSGLNGKVIHALWTIHGLGAFKKSSSEALNVLHQALSSPNASVRRNAIKILDSSESSSGKLAESGLLNDENLHVRLAAILKASDLPETELLISAMDEISKDETNKQDKWLSSALKVYYKERGSDKVDPSEVDMVVPSAEEGKVIWKYTFDKPSKDWTLSGFNDEKWAEGEALFGGSGDMESKAKTKWDSEEIWLRREINLESDIIDPVLKIVFDEDYKVFVDGKILHEQNGYSKKYTYVKLEKKKEVFLAKGKHIIAVHCKNTNGGQHIDMGLGRLGEPKADVVLNLNTVSQIMAYDQKILNVNAGQKVKFVLNNVDQMPHNLVLIESGSLESFGKTVDAFLTSPDAAEQDYLPKSRYIIGATEMLDPGESSFFFFTAPDKPGRYPYICTFPGHWRLMQGVLIVHPPTTFISDNPNATKLQIVGGGGSHNFLKFFGKVDGKLLHQSGKVTVHYTENTEEVETVLDDVDVLCLTNNKPIPALTRKSIFKNVKRGMGMMIVHPSTWYNWKDWPEYNKELVGGGSESHEKLQEFEIRVVKKGHPIMQGVPQTFRITDELYRWKKDPDAVNIEVLAIGKGIESGEEFPVVWVVKHRTSRIVGNTLGHDERAHELPAYQAILKNSLNWITR